MHFWASDQKNKAFHFLTQQDPAQDPEHIEVNKDKILLLECLTSAELDDMLPDSPIITPYKRGVTSDITNGS